MELLLIGPDTEPRRLSGARGWSWSWLRPGAGRPHSVSSLYLHAEGLVQAKEYEVVVLVYDDDAGGWGFGHVS